ncbi:WhiB family transcriptional regulator [Streptomyces sp. SP17BM10]|uniref:WhiB family transcriptional regulator n=1 Tax=Streptomyces sp. SP17BM10 TaxID=3002530 RepID=UPI002E78C2AB|nr:WhiB family transcriptional regulator [Streptomyces sp. SP17BM10]MEE1786561.1 WhiB family transcriptional regulator [Streptomyces sp. SP17BM10]
MADITRLPGAFEHRWSWQLRGACRTVDSSVFFHPVNERGAAAKQREEEAKSVCARCPVLAECRRYAMEVREPYGVWGGLTEDERRTLIARRRSRRTVAAWRELAG